MTERALRASSRRLWPTRLPTLLLAIFLAGCVSPADGSGPTLLPEPSAGAPSPRQQVPQPAGDLDRRRALLLVSWPTPAPTPAPTRKPTPKPTRRPTATMPPVSRVPSIAAAQRWARARLGATQYACLYSLVQRESRWRVNATNRRSGAYGLPQALPGSKMARYGKDWRTNPITQLRWMIAYVRARYGSACGAYRHARMVGWY